MPTARHAQRTARALLSEYACAFIVRPISQFQVRMNAGGACGAAESATPDAQARHRSRIAGADGLGLSRGGVRGSWASALLVQQARHRMPEASPNEESGEAQACSSAQGKADHASAGPGARESAHDRR